MITGVAAYRKKHHPISLPPIEPPQQPEEPERPPQKLPQEMTYEPRWTHFASIRQAKERGLVWSDVESHIHAGHIYKSSEPVNSVHETTHGINSNLRQGMSRKGEMVEHDGQPLFCSFSGVNAFYVLENRSMVLQEPASTVSAAARLVPRSLQARTFNLYMVQQAKSWNNSPLYVFDEWTAYMNGSACRADLKLSSRADTVASMFHFNVYASCVAWASKTTDTDIRDFLGWGLARSMELYRQNQEVGGVEEAEAYWKQAQTASDAEEWRQFIRDYLSAQWSQRFLGF